MIKHGLIANYDSNYFDNWASYAKQTYGIKKPSQLKIAFLCGPKPENDVIELLKLGVRIENIYAFENNKKHYKSAIESLRYTFPLLKIFNGDINHFFTSTNTVFDIIYLDFTTSLLSKSSKVFKTINLIFENCSLASLGVFILNTTYPDKTKENIDFLTRYFLHRPFYDYLIHDSKNEEDDYRILEGNSCLGIYEFESFRPYIEKNFEYAYSAFQTDFVNDFSSSIQPIINIVRNPILFSRIFSTNDTILKRTLEIFEESEYTYLNNHRHWLHLFMEDLKTDKSKMSNVWSTFFTDNRYNRKSIDSAIKIYSLFLDLDQEEFFEILSKSLRKAIPEIMQNVPDRRGGLFCDVPMLHLWLEMAINQLGNVYHLNTKQHLRYSYQAKTRRMCLDIFHFDQCKALYDWLPMIEFYSSDLKILERQILTRSCIDAICKHGLHILDNQYFGGHLVCINDAEWSKNHYYSTRKNITIS